MTRATGRRHVLITDAGRGSAVAFIRSLGRRGWKVTAADHDPASAGFHSRHTTDKLLYPRPSEHPDAVVEAILARVERDGIDLVVPITDELGLPLAEARARFAGLTTLAIPEPEALAATHDKSATFALAERLGIAVPATRVVDVSADAEALGTELGFPVVVKPVASREVLADRTIRSNVVSYAADTAGLQARLASLPAGTSVMLQRWVPGDGIGVELLMDHGRPLVAFEHRRLREFPPTGGASSLRESVALDEDLRDQAVRMLGELGWTGLAMVEFRRGKDGVGYLMEINGRVWGSLPLAVRAGVDFPGRLADLLLDGTPGIGTADTEYRRGVRARNLRLDIAWIGSVLSGRRRQRGMPWPSRRQAVGAMVGLLDPRIGDDLMSWRDPAPGLAQLGTIVRDGLRDQRRSDA
ncbi:MAG TPA: ATP-grasp domain-containing protein [Candidatus Limnocylindrales bacterium]|nr:ATP-grasp domain-containing protein [Candidatus Limnocylindrales bacterium]